MSVRRRPDRGNRPEVRWKEGGRHRSRLFDKVRDAEAFDREIKRNQQLGGLATTVVQSRMTLTDFVVDEWWPKYAIPNLDQSTREVYAQIWGKHLLPRIGGYELRQLTPALVEDLRAQMHGASVGEPTQIKALGILQGICKRAVVRGLIHSNPVLPVDKPRQTTRLQLDPLSPLVVEKIRAQLEPRDAILVSVLAYAGLRPEEAQRRRWQDARDRTIQVYADKTKRPRIVDLLAPLTQDLAEWRLQTGRPGAAELIVPTRDGDEWKKHDWNNWRKRVYQPAARAVGVTGDMRPRRLRGSFVSLLLWEGRSVTYVAGQIGCSIATLARHYAGVIAELEGQPRVPAADAIRAARTELAPGSPAQRGRN
jgi:integrase